MDAEFEEKEYEMPLNNQLLQGNQNLWTPGQVFEGNFGIDAALEVHRHDFWRIVGYPYPLHGVILSHFHFGYIWKKLDKKKPLPTFKLNLFLQAKRPQGLKNRPSNLKSLGLNSPYWRFWIKNHQQKLLSKLKAKLKNRAFVAYGCSAFHLYSDLFQHIENNSIVENSTFVKVQNLDNHSKWVYDKAGSEGIALSKPVRIDNKPLFDEINSVEENFTVENDNPRDNLRIISRAITELSEELSNENEIAKEILRRYKYTRNLKISSYLQQYLNVVNYCQLTSTNWMVIK